MRGPYSVWSIFAPSVFAWLCVAMTKNPDKPKRERGQTTGCRIENTPLTWTAPKDGTHKDAANETNQQGATSGTKMQCKRASKPVSRIRRIALNK